MVLPSLSCGVTLVILEHLSHGNLIMRKTRAVMLFIASLLVFLVSMDLIPNELRQVAYGIRTAAHAMGLF